MSLKNKLRVLSDIHGNYNDFKHLVEEGLKLNYSFILLGDVIGKGPESLKTMQLAVDLVEKGIAKIVLGNWEKAFIAFYTGRKHSKHYEPEILKIQQQVESAGTDGLIILDRFLTVLCDSYPWLVMDERVFVHAVWDDAFLKYGESPKYNELTNKEAKNYFGRACTGHNNYEEGEDYEYNGIDWSWLDKLSQNKRVYTGHISVDYITEVQGSKGAIAYMLDTGSGKKGALSCYDIHL